MNGLLCVEPSDLDNMDGIIVPAVCREFVEWEFAIGQGERIVTV